MFIETSLEREIYRPDLDTFREMAEGTNNLIPVVRTYPADLETPVTVYIKLMNGPGPSFLLESVEGGEQVGRYSFVGVNPRGSISLKGDEVIIEMSRDKGMKTSERRRLDEGQDYLTVLKDELSRFTPAELPGLPRFSGGAVGYLGYDVVRYFESLPSSAKPVHDVPEAIFLLADTLVVFDHARHQLLILANAFLDGGSDADVDKAYVDAIQRIERVSEKLLRPLPAIPSRLNFANMGASNKPELQSNKSQAEFEQMVSQAKEYIAAGDIFQVVLSQRLRRPTFAHPFAVYRALRMLNPSPYMFYFDFGDEGFQVVGASPEMHVRLEDGIASVRPIAGTRWRGKTEAEDKALEAEMLADEKERAEHVMLVDLGRNDIGRVCKFGTVEVRDLMTVERYSHVMHIVSQVEGEILLDKDAFDLMRATFPAGTVSGAPKVRAMEIIEEQEAERRGIYAGAVGYFSHDGSMDTCIAIRTMLVKEGDVFIQAGAGIVADSDESREYQECMNKARALIMAVEQAELGLT